MAAGDVAEGAAGREDGESHLAVKSDQTIFIRILHSCMYVLLASRVKAFTGN